MEQANFSSPVDSIRITFSVMSLKKNKSEAHPSGRFLQLRESLRQLQVSALLEKHIVSASANFPFLSMTVPLTYATVDYLL